MRDTVLRRDGAAVVRLVIILRIRQNYGEEMQALSGFPQRASDAGYFGDRTRTDRHPQGGQHPYG